MKKILILSYFFAPCNLTPSARITYWAKNLNRLGYYPVIVTRNWDRNIKHWEDTFLPSGDSVQYKKEMGYEVHYLPYKANLRDWVYLKFNKKYTKPLYFIFRILEVFSLAFTNYLIPYKNLYRFADNYLKENRDIEKMIISASPFYLFRFGKLLHKKHGISWIADYRDDWTTNKIQNANFAFLRKIINTIEGYYEKNWLKTADTFITVSQFYKKKISVLLKKDGHCVYNGYDESILRINRDTYSDITFSYSGITYPSQNIELLLQVFNRLIRHYRNKTLIRVNFVGSAYNTNEGDRIRRNIPADLEASYHVTPFLPREKALDILSKSHLLFIMAYGDNKGIPSSKLYEYVGLRKPVFLFPTDSDVIEQILSETGLGIIASNPEEAFNKLDEFIANFTQTGKSGIEMKEAEILKYSRSAQLEELVRIIAKER